jgi:predicted DNA-binding protein
MSKKSILPDMTNWSDEQIVKFYQEHDPEGYWAPEVRVRHEASNMETVSIRMPKDDVERLRRLAKAHGMDHTSLVRRWIVEHLDQEATIGEMLSFLKLALRHAGAPEIRKIEFFQERETRNMVFGIIFEGIEGKLEYALHPSQLASARISLKPMLEFVASDLREALRQKLKEKHGIMAKL